ncbi:trypsin-like serine protease [Linderina pennispora]|uniref:Trypsin-like serine protease n=1 Tax=Linderina pennispora TaxID=61395 RepID=A0A1Y1WL81_9FUNG|nr:trypsin-like serine protease [Linderina pennispora]ORX74331.1 trypsin-like serine protease [Linderina pennispora]
MKITLPIFFGSVLAQPSFAPEGGSRVTNGTNTPQGTAPWAVILYGWQTNSASYSQCTGAILDNTTILVAAHCIHNPETGIITPPSQMTIGYNSVNEYKQKHVNVSQTFVHPLFNLWSIENDIGVLKLAWAITLTPGYAEALTIYDGTIDPHQAIDVYGWGVEDANSEDTPSYLQHGTVYTGIIDDCQAANSDFTDNNGEQICIEYIYSPGVGTCYGDSGGSTTININGIPYGAGIVSYNQYMSLPPNQCATPGDYSFYTHTFYYLLWIQKVAGVAYITGPYGNGVLKPPPSSSSSSPTPTSTSYCLFFICF